MKNKLRRHVAPWRSAAGGLAAVLLPILLLGGAAACKGIDIGGVAYADPIFEKSYLLATDAKKHTVTDEAGMLIALRTEPDGSIITQPDGENATMVLEYPCFVHEKKIGKTVLEVADFTVKLPGKWRIVSDTKSIVITPAGVEIPRTRMSYSSHRESYEEMKKQLEAREAAFNEMIAADTPDTSVRSFTKNFYGKEGFFLEFTIGDIIQVNGIVQPGDFCAEVDFQCPAEEYKDGKTFFELTGIMEGK